MRLLAILAITLLLASADRVAAATETEKVKTATAISLNNRLTIRALASGQIGSLDKRLLRLDQTYEGGEETEERGFFSGLSSMFGKAKFWYWKKTGRTPGEIYPQFFRGLDDATIRANTNYPVIPATGTSATIRRLRRLPNCHINVNRRIDLQFADS